MMPVKLSSLKKEHSDLTNQRAHGGTLLSSRLGREIKKSNRVIVGWAFRWKIAVYFVEIVYIHN